MMRANVGVVDRIVRIVLGLVTAFTGYSLGGLLGYVLYAAAALLLLTGAVGWCGLYALLGFSTCPVRKSA